VHRPRTSWLVVAVICVASCSAGKAQTSGSTTGPSRTTLSSASETTTTTSPAARISSEGAFVTPIQPENQPTPISGATNGELPPSDLLNVAPGCQAARAAGPSLGLLLTEARDRDVVLGTEQCYRSLQGQEQEAQIWAAAGNSACAAPIVTSPSGQPEGTSMHGWGKAADFFDSTGTVSFGSPGSEFLNEFAGQVGWNHPGWAEPGGSACPEAWHWEWVGDGGTLGASPIRADVVGLLWSGDDRGYASVSGLGGIVARGDFVDYGSAESITIAWLIVGAASFPRGGGYWLVGADGGVFSFGDASFYGSMGGQRLNEPVVGIVALRDGGGYWLVGADGGVFSFGDAAFYGSA
jgi:LAS superfamily LD-carboxypeptidase LdcB